MVGDLTDEEVEKLLVSIRLHDAKSVRSDHIATSKAWWAGLTDAQKKYADGVKELATVSLSGLVETVDSLAGKVLDVELKVNTRCDLLAEEQKKQTEEHDWQYNVHLEQAEELSEQAKAQERQGEVQDQQGEVQERQGEVQERQGDRITETDKRVAEPTTGMVELKTDMVELVTYMTVRDADRELKQDEWVKHLPPPQKKPRKAKEPETPEGLEKKKQQKELDAATTKMKKAEKNLKCLQDEVKDLEAKFERNSPPAPDVALEPALDA